MPSYALPLINGDAGTGDLTGWTVLEGNFGVDARATSSYVVYTPYAFYGGTNSTGAASAYQDVVVPVEAEADIDAGLLNLVIDYWLGGDAADLGKIVCAFYDGADVEISAAETYDRGLMSSAAANEQPYGYLSWAAPVPAGTRKIRFTLVTTYVSGATINSVFSEIRPRLASGYVLPLVNAGAPDDLTGWTISHGSPDVASVGGIQVFRFTTDEGLYQDVDVSALAAELDEEDSIIYLAWEQAYRLAVDVGVEFLDGDGISLGMHSSPFLATTSSSNFYGYRRHYSVPAGTRTVRIWMDGESSTWSAYIRNISAFIVTDALVGNDLDLQWRIIDGDFLNVDLSLRWAIRGYTQNQVRVGWRMGDTGPDLLRPMPHASPGLWGNPAISHPVDPLDASPLPLVPITSPIDVVDFPPADVALSLHQAGEILYRVWVIPDLLRLQNPQLNVPIPFEIWSAYPWENELLEVGGEGLTGLSIDTEAGDVWGHSELRVVNITINPDAPIQVDARITFDFEFDDGVLLFEASIADFVQMVPDPPVEEYWEWLTDVITAWDGTEQRISLRSSPRRGTSYSFPLETEEERRVQYNRWYKSLASRIVLPYYQYATGLTQRSAQGADKLFFDPARTDMRAGEFAILLDTANEQGYLIAIAEVVADGAILDAPLTFDAEKDWVLAPAFTSRLADRSGLSMRAISGKITIDSEQLDTREQFTRPGSTAVISTFDGYNVLDRRPLADQDVPETFYVNYEVLDSDTGIRDIASSWPHPVVEGPRRFLVQRHIDPGEFDFWRDFLAAANGQQNTFLVPTWRNDLTQAMNPDPNASSVTISNTDFASLYYPYNTYRRLQIETSNGTFWRRILNLQENADGTATLELDGSFGGNPGDTEIRRISFLNVCRLASDRVRLSHHHLETTIEIQIRTVDE